MEASPWYATAPWVAPFWRAFRQDVETSGFAFQRAEELDPAEPRPVLLITQGLSSLSAELVRRPGVIPAILMSLESPMIDYEFYHSLPRLAKSYRQVFVFHGAKKRVRPAHKFRSFFHPQVPPAIYPDGIPSVPWRERGYLVAVHANKFAAAVSMPNLFRALLARFFSSGLQTLKPSIRRQLICLSDRELARGYDVRLRAIVYFSRFNDFDLYGRGWTRAHAYSAPPDLVRLAARRYVGELEGHEDKLRLLTRYRFALAIENTSFPGYITEKIYDCFYARCVPVYYGPPDIERFIPPETFVDLRRFRSLDHLNRHLRTMSEGSHRAKVEAAQAFLCSPQFKQFHFTTESRLLAAALSEIHAELSGM